jgi:Protein of unknown function (DUF3754)
MTSREREHFIPLRKKQLLEILCALPGLTQAEQSQFRQLYRLLEATFHFEFHTRLEDLKDAYASFDPDADTQSVVSADAAELERQLGILFDKFVTLLDRANFTRMSRNDIRKALDSASDWGLNLNVDFDVFDRIELFSRGDRIGRRSKRNWRNRFQLEEVDVPIYRRLVLILRLRDHPLLGKKVDTQSVFIKIFKDIPKQDVEMLLPGTTVRMTIADRGKIVLPALSGLMITIWKIIKGALVLAAAGVYGTLAFLGLVGGTIGYGMRSFYGYQQTKQKYQLSLTQSLYYQNLDNNSGALCRLIDEAEEQECREAMLAYFFLWRQGSDAGWTGQQLDDAIESFLEQRVQVQVDFELSDAIDKLKRLQLVEPVAEDRLRAVPIDVALGALDRAWDGYFQYADQSTGAAVKQIARQAGPHLSNRDSVFQAERAG